MYLCVCMRYAGELCEFCVYNCIDGNCILRGIHTRRETYVCILICMLKLQCNININQCMHTHAHTVYIHTSFIAVILIIPHWRPIPVWFYSMPIHTHTHACINLHHKTKQYEIMNKRMLILNQWVMQSKFTLMYVCMFSHVGSWVKTAADLHKFLQKQIVWYFCEYDSFFLISQFLYWLDTWIRFDSFQRFACHQSDKNQ